MTAAGKLSVVAIMVFIATISSPVSADPDMLQDVCVADLNNGIEFFQIPTDLVLFILAQRENFPSARIATRQYNSVKGAQMLTGAVAVKMLATNSRHGEKEF
ncbi:hypothetical protein RHSIM_Rhsim11G0110300 [Rhododendron simsii]|uniref:Uncharacterized protein n=1 Tax=Rhododendron simsii TaxID=118357 RepID=A0A834LB32_RHOSS|nr:hypothetical protein RHSIM_Rhsim11G0110300 [Rhododendron simsii]